MQQDGLDTTATGSGSGSGAGGFGGKVIVDVLSSGLKMGLNRNKESGIAVVPCC